MKISVILLFVAVGILFVKGDVEDVRITIKPMKQRYHGSEDIWLLLQLLNEGSDDLGLLDLINSPEELTEPIFSIYFREKPVEYVGAVAKRRAFTTDDYIPLAAGASITIPVKISNVYNMTRTGNYVIQTKMNAHYYFTNLSVMRKGQSIPSVEDDTVLTSVPIGLFAEAHRNAILEDSLAIAQGRYVSPTYLNCNSAQTIALGNAIREAENYASNAVNYFSTYNYPTTRYVTWYGSGSFYWENVKTNWNNLKNTLAAKAISFNCACTAGTSSTYAYVYPTQPYIVYLCGQHWISPLTGTDSQGGTIIHELAHFLAVAGTRDHVYGQSGAKNLAINDPSRAIANSDTYQYFCENNPYQS